MENEISEYLKSKLVESEGMKKEAEEMVNASQCVPNSEIEKLIAKLSEDDTEESSSELRDALLLWLNTGGKVFVPVENQSIDDEQIITNIHGLRLITDMTEEDEPFQVCYTSLTEAELGDYTDFACIPFEDILEECLAGSYESIVFNYESDNLYLELDEDLIEFLMGKKYKPEASEVMRYSFLFGLYKKDDPEGTDTTYPSIAIFPKEDTSRGKWSTAITYTMVLENTFMNSMWGFGVFNQKEKSFEDGSDIKMKLVYREDAVGKVGLKVSGAKSKDKLNFMGTYRKVANWEDVKKHFPLGGMSTIDKWIAL